MLKGMWFEGLMSVYRKIFWSADDYTVFSLGEKLKKLEDSKNSWMGEEVQVFFHYKSNFCKKYDISIDIDSKKWIKKRKGRDGDCWVSFEDADEIHLGRYKEYIKYESSLKDSLKIMGNL